MPNIVHQVFCYLQKPKKSGHVVEKYLKDNQEISDT